MGFHRLANCVDPSGSGKPERKDFNVWMGLDGGIEEEGFPTLAHVTKDQSRYTII